MLSLEVPVLRANFSSWSIDQLNRRLSNLPVKRIRTRCQTLQNFYNEVLVSFHPELGIELKDFLMIYVAHYKIDESKASLIPEEDRKRRAWLQLVTESIRKERIMNSVECIYWRRYLRKHSSHGGGRCES
jgi:hypothetical protein